MTPTDNPLPRIVAIARSLTQERDRWALYRRILDEAHRLTHAEGSTLYLLDGDARDACLQAVIVRNDPLDLMAVHGDTSPLPALALADAAGRPDHAHVASHCALTRAVVSINDVSHETRFDLSGVRTFDREHAYTTRCLLSVPLLGHDQAVVGVIQLINPRYAAYDGRWADGLAPATLPLVESLCSLAAVAIDNHRLASRQHDILITLAGKRDAGELFETILDLACRHTHAEGGTLYLCNKGDDPRLQFAIVKNSVLGLHLGGARGEPLSLPDVPLSIDGIPNHAHIASHAALTRQRVNVPDAYANSGFDFSGTRAFDTSMHYRSTSILCVPLLNHADDVTGVLQLINARDPATDEVIPFSETLEPLIAALGTYAGIVLDNRLLLDETEALLDAFIKCIAQAIDAKSSHTSAHCQRIPVLTDMLARATCADTRWFPDFNMSSDDLRELEIASWLHDCGKLSTPDRVLDKSTKLQSLRDGIDTVLARIGIITRDLEIERLRAQIDGRLSADQVAALDARQAQLADDAAFLQRINKGGEFMPPEERARVLRISDHQWKNVKGEWQSLLTPEEIENLCIERGTLNNTERALINDHMRVTVDMLDSLPFPKHLRRVPEYACGHHEKMDGSGFPRGLTRDQMSLPARMMAIADVFEALTASERPYKPPMKLSQALPILQRMKNVGHIDPDLYQVFLEQRVWERYAQHYLRAEQLDVTDIEGYR